MSKKTICVSGGFDPVHIGHLRMIQEASKYGHVVAIVNSDDWLMRKKGYIFMPFDERCEILEGFSATGETTRHSSCNFAAWWYLVKASAMLVVPLIFPTTSRPLCTAS